MITINGRKTFEHKIRALRRSTQKRPPRNHVLIGNWLLEEDTDGNLIIRNMVSNQEITLVTFEGG